MPGTYAGEAAIAHRSPLMLALISLAGGAGLDAGLDARDDRSSDGPGNPFNILVWP